MLKSDEDILTMNLTPEIIRFDHMCQAMIEVGTKTHELDEENVESLKGMIEFYRAAPPDVKAELDAFVLERAKGIQTAMKMELAQKGANVGSWISRANPRFPH